MSVKPTQSEQNEELLQRLIDGSLPDEFGRYGMFGGRYVPETLVPALERLEQGMRDHLDTPEFREEQLPL